MNSTIEEKLKVLETYNEPQARKAREVMKASITEPIIIQKGPFRGMVKCTLPLSMKELS